MTSGNPAWSVLLLAGFAFLPSCGPGIAALPEDAQEDGEADAEINTCPEGFIRCDDECVDPMRSDVHCGECDRSCREQEICLAGLCACPPGTTACDDECVDVSSDAGHCGECERPCEESRVCSSGECLVECDEGLVECEGRSCIDLASCNDHCGSCETACEDDEICVASGCRDFEPADGCGACPCAACDDSGYLCCPLGDPQVPFCIDASTCP